MILYNTLERNKKGHIICYYFIQEMISGNWLWCGCGGDNCGLLSEGLGEEQMYFVYFKSPTNHHPTTAHPFFCSSFPPIPPLLPKG